MEINPVKSHVHYHKPLRDQASVLGTRWANYNRAAPLRDKPREQCVKPRELSKSEMHHFQMLLEPVSETGQNGKIGKSRVAARTSQGDLRGAALPVSVQSNRGVEGKRVPFAGP